MVDIELFRLHDTGEYSKIENISFDNVETHLVDENDVIIILHPEIRRLYIWQGRKAPVNKKFISSRVAGLIQRDRVKNAGMQHKIVAIEQDEEPDEFITNLCLKNVKTEAQRVEEKKKKEEEEAKRFEALMSQPDITPDEKPSEQNAVHASSQLVDFMKRASANITPASIGYGPVVNPGAHASTGLSDKEKQEILDSVLKESIPDGYKRENLVLDQNLYVNVKKTGDVFGEEVTIESWDPFNGALKDGFIDIQNRRVRLLVQNNKIKAVEILKQVTSQSP
nr:hypothetical protein [Candidatus Sigynarchaeota archaeon]